MSIITVASGKSVWRGYDYFLQGKVVSVENTAEDQFEGIVSGSNGALYSVMINAKHVRKSHCNCPHATGRVVCKHMVAMFFAVFPEEARKYKKWRESYEQELEEEQQRMENRESRIYEYVCSLSAEQAHDLILVLLNELPDWRLEDFVREYVDSDDVCPDDDNPEDDDYFEDEDYLDDAFDEDV